MAGPHTRLLTGLGKSGVLRTDYRRSNLGQRAEGSPLVPDRSEEQRPKLTAKAPHARAAGMRCRAPAVLLTGMGISSTFTPAIAITWHCDGPVANKPSDAINISRRSNFRTDAIPILRLQRFRAVNRYYCLTYSSAGQPPIARTSRNSSSPQTPPSRPLPDCFMPPNGDPALRPTPLISTMPDRS